MQRRGHLIDFAELLLHALTGATGNLCRLVGSLSGVLHRALDLGNGRLQLIEKTVESVGQSAQLVTVGVVQAAGQVAFALGDVFEHCGKTQQRAGNAARRQPDQQHAEDCSEGAQAQFQHRALQACGIELALQHLHRRQQHLLRHTQQHTPSVAAGNRFQGFEHRDVLVVAEGFGLGLGEGGKNLRGFVRVHLLQGAAQLAGFLAAAGNQAGGAEDTDLAIAIVEFAAVGRAALLQAVEADVQAQHGDGAAVLDQGEGDAGDQPAGARRLVEIGLQDAQLAAVA
ncbi:hypothetical protein D3C76_879200 [compost metagenome]